MNQISHINQNDAVISKQTISNKNEMGFQEKLRSAIENKTNNTTPTQIGEQLGEISLNQVPQISKPIEDVQARTHSLLNNLESYADELNDPSKTLREIEPLINTIQRDAQQLNNNITQISSDNEPLIEVANQSVVVANLEYIKFHRGDYT